MGIYEVEAIKEKFEFLKGITDEPFSTAFAAGEPIFHEGERADFLYIIESGTVEIEFQGIVLERISEGRMFGEMSLADDKERSASATAHTAVVALAISKSMFCTACPQRSEFLVAGHEHDDSAHPPDECTDEIIRGRAQAISAL